jgi:hypothetical protein
MFANMLSTVYRKPCTFCSGVWATLTFFLPHVPAASAGSALRRLSGVAAGCFMLPLLANRCLADGRWGGIEKLKSSHITPPPLLLLLLSSALLIMLLSLLTPVVQLLSSEVSVSAPLSSLPELAALL